MVSRQRFAGRPLTGKVNAMAMYHLDEQRYDDPYALPDLEVFYVSAITCAYNLLNLDHADEYTVTEPGWYYWFCFPGCMPDSTAFGPFDTEEEAVTDARNTHGEG